MTRQDGESTSQDGQPTLTSFIEENHRLITALGVFTALTVFASNLPLRSYGRFLSFLFMALTVLVWLELWGKFPSGRGTSRLFWFESILSLAIVSVLGYWLLDFRAIWNSVLFVLVFGIVLYVVVWPFKRFDLFNRLFKAEPGKKKTLRYILGAVIIGACIFISSLVATSVSDPVNRLLDAISQSTPTPRP